MKKRNVKNSILLVIVILLIGASVLPSLSGISQKTKIDYDYEEENLTLPRWREGGTPYDSNQSLYPYCISLREKPTSGYIESPPEYGPTQGVLFTFGGWSSVVRDMVVALTEDDDYDEIAYIVVPNQAARDSAYSYFQSGGANMDKVEFIIEYMDSVWIRDYGPHFIWQDNTLGIVDSHYYPDRYHDNFIPTLVGDDHFIIPTYDMGLYYSGGNFQPGPNRTGFVTSLVKSDNPGYQGFDEEFIAELYQTYQGIDELHILPQLPISVDLTGHIDMWLNIVDEDTVIISEFLPGSNAQAIQITNNAVPYMEDLGFEVFRTPAWNAPHPTEGFNTHWTYTNAFRVNDRYFIPTYGETYPSYADEDSAALAAFQAAVGPDVEIIQINCYPIIWAAGAMHCIVMQVPRYVDNEPSVHVISPDGGELLVTGSTQTIRWSATDTYNCNIPQIDLYYSIDDDSTYEFIDTTTNTGSYEWKVPYVYSDKAKIKVIATSNDSDIGEGVSNDFFEIASAIQTVYDFKSEAGINKFCFGHQTSNWLDIDGIRKPVSYEISSSNYPRIAESDANGNDNDPNRYRSPTPSDGKESTHIYQIELNEDPKDIINIDILWEGYADSCTQIELYVWDYFRGKWSDGAGQSAQNLFMDNWAGNRDGYLKGSIRDDFDHYIGSNNEMTLLLYAERSYFRSFHDYISITICTSNDPPDPPVIVGEDKVKANESYDYLFTSSEPDGDEVSYYIDWGDGNITDWTDYQDPDTSYTEDHIWSNQKNFEIRAKARDIVGAESEWATLEITTPRTRFLFDRPILSSIIKDFTDAFSILRVILKLF